MFPPAPEVFTRGTVRFAGLPPVRYLSRQNDEKDFLFFGEKTMETKIALIAIIVKDGNSSAALNSILHEYGHYIIGRMGLPYPKREINIISIAIDAPMDIISALSGKIGRLSGVSAKTVYAPASALPSDN